jgi:hypothetical protein
VQHPANRESEHFEPVPVACSRDQRVVRVWIKYQAYSYEESPQLAKAGRLIGRT